MIDQRRVLITGGMGFIGSHLCESLLQSGDAVTAIDNLSTGRFENVAHLRDNAAFTAVVDDLENTQLLDRLVSQSDLVIHLAAAVGVELVVDDPIRTIETNIEGTSAVLKSAARYRVKTMIASTSEVYGKSTALPFREDADVVLGASSKSRWSYAASKLVDEFLGLAYGQHRGVPVVVFRLFNTVGPRQSGRYGMVVPRFVQAALDARPLSIYGDGQQSRCFLHVADAVAAMSLLSEAEGAVGEVFNIGSGELVTIEELARRVLARVDRWQGQPPASTAGRLSYTPYQDVYSVGFEDMRTRRPDTSKLTMLTGWEAKHTLEEILDDVIADRSPAPQR